MVLKTVSTLGATGGGGTVTAVTGSGNIASSGGTTPNITFTGTLPIANGGTNSTATPTAGGAGYGTGTAHAYTAAGTSGQPLISAGAGAPAFGNLGTGAGGTGLTSFTANGVVYASSSSALATGSTLVFDGTNLGIGTSSPTQKLDVRGSVYVQRDTNPTNALALQLTNQTTVSNNGCRLSFDVYNIGSAALGVPSDSASLAFYTGGVTSERMRLDTSGNLGLGVTPSAWNANFKSLQMGYAAFTSDNSNGRAEVLNNSYASGASTYTYVNSLAATRYSQQLGVHAWFNAPSGTAGNAITFTQAMTLNASGNLLVGTTSQFSNARLTVSSTATDGIASTQGTAGGYCFVANALTNGGTFYHASFGENGTQRGSITSNGTITSYNTTSDYRLKTVIGPVADAGQRIDALKPVEYTWNSDGSRTRGFLAHQFQEVYASSVTGTKDAVDAEGKPVYQAMQASTPEVIADLVAEIQSLRIRIAQLEAK